VKAGSFESVGAKVDGHDAVVGTRQDGDVFDIAVAAEIGILPRGKHVIELSHTAKHQFAIFDNFEDLIKTYPVSGPSQSRRPRLN
jgi:hypothetical protein